MLTNRTIAHCTDAIKYSLALSSLFLVNQYISCLIDVWHVHKFFAVVIVGVVFSACLMYLIISLVAFLVARNGFLDSGTLVPGNWHLLNHPHRITLSLGYVADEQLYRVYVQYMGGKPVPVGPSFTGQKEARHEFDRLCAIREGLISKTIRKFMTNNKSIVIIERS